MTRRILSSNNKSSEEADYIIERLQEHDDEIDWNNNGNNKIDLRNLLEKIQSPNSQYKDFEKVMVALTTRIQPITNHLPSISPASSHASLNFSQYSTASTTASSSSWQRERMQHNSNKFYKHQAVTANPNYNQQQQYEQGDASNKTNSIRGRSKDKKKLKNRSVSCDPIFDYIRMES